MYCPSCGQERLSNQTSFCSRCGFLLTGVTELLATGGIILRSRSDAAPARSSARSRGLKQGVFIFLLTFLIVPIVAIISVGLDFQPWGISVAAIMLFVGGLLRMAYALMFESERAPAESGTEAALSAPRHTFLEHPPLQGALPPQPSTHVSSYIPPAGTWRDTKDLQPTSVTEGTTKLLEKDEDQ